MRPGLRVISVGKLRDEFVRDFCDDYVQRLTHLVTKLECLELPDEPTPDGIADLEEDSIRLKEGQRILAKVGERDYVVACDLNGKQLTSPEFAQHIMDAVTFRTASTFTLIIGGSLGLHRSVLDRADFRWCFGKLTLPHALARVVALEQFYRALKIIRGEAYHK